LKRNFGGKMVHQNIQDTREEEKIKMRNDIEHTHTTQPLVQEILFWRIYGWVKVTESKFML
jgi:predicted ATPase